MYTQPIRPMEAYQYFLHAEQNTLIRSLFKVYSLERCVTQLIRPLKVYIYIFSSSLNVRQNTIFKLPANLLNITTLLHGDPYISSNMNSLIFKAVLDFIVHTRRFTMEWQTQLNSYWHKRILSLTDVVVVVIFLLLNITCFCKMNFVNYAYEHLL